MFLEMHKIYYALRGVNVECRCCYLSIGQIGHFLPEPIVTKDFHVKTWGVRRYSAAANNSLAHCP